MIRRLIGAGMLLLAACATEPDPALVVSGTVRSAATQAPIAGARVELRYRAPFSPTTVFIATAPTRSDGTFSLEIREQPGHNFHNCSLLHLEVTAPGFIENSWVPIGGADSPACEAGEVEVAPITLLPAESELSATSPCDTSACRRAE